MADVPSSTVAKWRDLVDRMIHATAQEKIKWKDSADDNYVLTTIGSLVVFFGKEFNINQEEPDYIVRVESQSGRTIDRFSDSDLGDRSYFSLMEEFYRTIQRNVSGADDVLDELLKQLPEVPKKQSDMDDEIPF